MSKTRRGGVGREERFPPNAWLWRFLLTETTEAVGLPHRFKLQSLSLAIEWIAKTVVKDGCVVAVTLPELHDGEEVVVLVRRNGLNATFEKRPGFGSARGLITMRDDFDAPIEDFHDYR